MWHVRRAGGTKSSVRSPAPKTFFSSIIPPSLIQVDLVTIVGTVPDLNSIESSWRGDLVSCRDHINYCSTQTSSKHYINSYERLALDSIFIASFPLIELTNIK